MTPSGSLRQAKPYGRVRRIAISGTTSLALAVLFIRCIKAITRRKVRDLGNFGIAALGRIKVNGPPANQIPVWLSSLSKYDWTTRRLTVRCLTEFPSARDRCGTGVGQHEDENQIPCMRYIHVLEYPSHPASNFEDGVPSHIVIRPVPICWPPRASPRRVAPWNFENS